LCKDNFQNRHDFVTELPAFLAKLNFPRNKCLQLYEEIKKLILKIQKLIPKFDMNFLAMRDA